MKIFVKWSIPLVWLTSGPIALIATLIKKFIKYLIDHQQGVVVVITLTLTAIGTYAAIKALRPPDEPVIVVTRTPQPGGTVTAMPTATATATASPTPTMTETATSTPTITATPTVSSTPAPALEVLRASQNRVTGRVALQYCDRSKYKILVYASSGSHNTEWDIQPSSSNGVSIQADCTWSATTGDWDRLAVYLVSTARKAALVIHTTGICPTTLIQNGGEMYAVAQCQ